MPATRPAAIAATDSSERATPDHRLTRLAHEVVRATDPEAALRTLRLLQDELALVERDCVAAALGDGSSFRSVADALGISRQAAHRRYRDLAPSVVRDESPALSSHARRALHLAREEATGMGAGALRSEHVLLGVLRSGGGVSRAMDAEGLSADAVRQCLPDGGAGTSAPGAADAARAVLAEAEEVARARRARCVEPDHLVLAALNAADGGALQAITALGVTPAAVRDRLGC